MRMFKYVPRRGEKFTLVNEDIERFNDMLEQSCDKFPDFHFCNNQQFVTDESGQVKGNLYENYLHLNHAGKKELGKSLCSVLKHAYFQNQVVTLPGSLAENNDQC